MKVDFLHYLWKFRKFDLSNLRTSNYESLTILHPGHQPETESPYFFNAQIIIEGQQWVGNVAIGVNSSDWHRQTHRKPSDNLILYVAWEHDTTIYRNDGSSISVLPIKTFVPDRLLQKYLLLLRPKSWIFCETQLCEIDPFILRHWQQRLFFERLERKSEPILQLLEQTKHDWEAVLFGLLAKNFGLNTNGSSFLKIAQSIPFAVIRKESHEPQNLEALLFGQSGLLAKDNQDPYCNDLKARFDYLSHKYRLAKPQTAPVQFFRHRPDNFPTIRLSQLANLYAGRQQLFSQTIEAVSVIMLYQIFGISAARYWKTHYRFGRASPEKEKQLSKRFIDLIIVNTVIPLQFAYAKSRGAENIDAIVGLVEQLSPENNTVIEKFGRFGWKAESAFASQSLLQLKSDYCDNGKCTQCAIGIELLKSNPIKV